jgi:extracellular elastinolytic metalloproteinase
MHKKLLNLLGFVLLSSLLSSLWSQETDALASALRHVFDQAKAWGLQENDLAGMTLNDRYQSRHNGVTHLYFRQRHEGIGVHNAILGVHVATDGSVIHTGNRFVAQLREKINTTQALLSAQQAVLIAARHLGLELQSPLNIVDSRGKTEVLFSEAGISRVPIRAELVYQPLSSQAIRLAWDIFIDQVDASDYWSFRIDAVDGSVLGQDNFTTYCQWEGSPHHRHSLHCALPSAGIAGLGHMAPAMSANESSPNAGPMYHVFPVPVESPAHGERERVIDPVDPESSPLGWHSTGSLPEQQFTITRGNNVHAYLDLDNSDVSKNDEPDGGEALQFDFPFNPAWEPDRYRDFSVTQAFYMSNYLHDLAYRYGFDEEAGNFQQNNFGKGGRGGDPVHVHVQDGGSRNNANFTTPPDGARGRMQMYLWEQNRDRIFSVNAPESIAGFLPVSTAAFGPAIDSTPISGRLVAAFDGAAIDADKGCGTLINAEELRGNIALVNRGVCFFQEKALRAAAAGAKACIICNFEDALINMGGVSTLPAPTIPTLMLRASDCERLRQFFRQGVEVTLRLSPSEGPRFFDGALDNGIVAHEYAHGISMRLTGGPGVSSCLNNDEQMGEGWSDFFTLASTFRPDDSGEATSTAAECAACPTAPACRSTINPSTTLSPPPRRMPSAKSGQACFGTSTGASSRNTDGTTTSLAAAAATTSPSNSSWTA